MGYESINLSHPMRFHKTIRRGLERQPPSLVRSEKGGYPREYTYKGNDNAFSTRSSPASIVSAPATDSVGRLITAEREQLYREVFGKNVELVL